jgi:hypothetical protein
MNIVSSVRVLLVALVCSTAVGCTSTQPDRSPPGIDQEIYLKTELYFGLSKPDGGDVSPEDWRTFLDGEITPRFPEGLTVVEATGQYLSATVGLVKEPSVILILLHPPTVTADTLIERIRLLYKTRFQQESVLRVSTPAGVSF